MISKIIRIPDARYHPDFNLLNPRENNLIHSQRGAVLSLTTAMTAIKASTHSVNDAIYI